MDVSSGNLQIPHFVAQKMDEEFSGIFFFTHYIANSEERDEDVGR